MSVAEPAPPPATPALNRTMITVTVMLASILQTLDNTIANVALPKMQGSLSATQDQMTWVLTSYIIAAAMMTPLTGWLAGQFGRKRVFLVSVAGFTVASMLCGVAQSLPQIVLFRFLQGLAGAALVPMSQAVLFDINPPERHGRAMAAWGQGVLIGPMIGPILGGWLTDNYSWRWVFYINLPLGILAFLGVLAFLPNGEQRKTRFDFLGFVLLATFVISLQMGLDRGPLKDWFDSTEIWIEFTLAALAVYLFAVHSATTAHPFFRPALFKDRNYVTGNVFIFIVGVVMFATLALLPGMLQGLMGYPVYEAGLLTAPRSIGTLAAMTLVGPFIGKIPSRWIIGSGFALTAVSLWQMTHFSADMGGAPIVISGLLQGFGTGLAYVPMATIAFASLPGNLRNEGSALFSLTRNIGSSIGISAVQALFVRNTQIVHSTLVEHVTPFNLENQNPQLAATLSSHMGMAGFNALATGQAAMVAYIDDFRLMFFLTLLTLPLLLLVREARKGRKVPEIALD